jgi:sigma-B regulation protein RsbU (phosphoserine phosphatase)
MSTPAARTTSAPARAAKHLSSECHVAKKNPTVSVSTDQMAELVERINKAKGSMKPAAAPVGETAYLQALSNEVLALREAVKKNEALAQSVERAQAVQRSMLPKSTPTVEGYEFATLFEPCDQVSGDFYDAFRLVPAEGVADSATGRIALVIGDVSGHGLEAALVMGMAKKAFSLRAHQDASAMSIMSKVNSDIFPDLQEGTFVSASFSILNPVSHTLSFTRAGHNPAILLRAATRTASLVNPPGMIVGVDAGPRFDKALRQEAVGLQPGDLFLQYTDGVTEAMDASDDEFGLTRLSDVITRTANQPAEIVVNEIHEALKQFMGQRTQEDDITLLVVRRLP